MQTDKIPANKRFAVMAVTALFLVAGITVMGPGAADDAPTAQTHPANDYDFDLTEFDAKGPSGNWDATSTEVTQTQSGPAARASFYVSDSSNLLGGPNYRDVIYTSEIDAPATGANNNIIGFALGLSKPSGTGTLVNVYILDWKAAEQTANGHTAPEGFTLYRIDGQVDNVDSETFACYWGKDPAACSTATGGNAVLEVIDSHTGAGTGWEHDATYHISIRHEADTIRAHVTGGTNYDTGTTVIDATGEFDEVAQFGAFNFAQEDVTYRNLGYRDEVAPVATITADCVDGTLVEDPSWTSAVAACGGSEDTLLRLSSSAEDHGAGLDSIECLLDGTQVGASPSECLAWQTLQDSGDYPYQVISADVLGNTGDVTEFYQLDKDPLDLEILFDCGGVFYADPAGAFKACDSPSTVEGTASVGFGAPVDTIACTVSDPAADDCASQLLATHGIYDFTLEATDLLGNTASLSDQFRVELEDPDVPVPECDIPSQPGSTLPGFELGWCRAGVTVEGAEALSGIAGESCEILDAADPAAVWEPVSCSSGLPDGVWLYRANATSNVGRLTQIGIDENIEVKLDSKKPEGALLNPEEGVSYIDGLQVPCEEPVLGLPLGQCVARGSIDVIIEAGDPLRDGFASGLKRVEIWDGTGGNTWLIETFDEVGGDGTFEYEWNTAEAPSHSEPHELVTRTLEVRLYDVAGGFERLEYEIFVLPTPGLPL